MYQRYNHEAVFNTLVFTGSTIYRIMCVCVLFYVYYHYPFHIIILNLFFQLQIIIKHDVMQLLFNYIIYVRACVFVVLSQVFLQDCFKTLI